MSTSGSVLAPAAEAVPEAPPGPPEPDDRVTTWASTSVPVDVVFVAVLVAATLLAAFVRVWIIYHSALDADQAVVGLMAQGIRNGHLQAFFWGQHYGGVEPYPVAALFVVFGEAPQVLNLTASVLALATALVVWRIGRHLFAPAAAMAAAVVAWIWSESTLWNSTREYGFHEVGLLLAMVVLLAALRIVDRPAPSSGRLGDWVLLGAAAGLGCWATPEVVFVALPTAFILVAGLIRRLSVALAAKAVVGLAAFAVGSAPWIWVSAETGWATLHFVTSPVPHNTYHRRLDTFFTHVAPMLLGTRIEGAGAWEGPATFAVVVTAVVVAVIGAAAVLVWLRVPMARFLVVFVVTFPFLYAAFPSNWFWNDGRYGIWATPMLALLVCGGLWALLDERWARVAGAGIVVVALVSTLFAFNVGYGALSTPSKLTDFSTNPNATIDDLAAGLEAKGVRDAYAGYWVAYELAYLSGGRVQVMPFQNDRNPADDHVVEDAPRAGWLFVHPGSFNDLAAKVGTTQFLESSTTTEAEFESWLGAHGVLYAVTRLGDFDLVLPLRNVRPSAVTG
ncbi:MAG: glycosyltransferase family 39 protein [Acidimicrobiales bacterium]